MGVVEVGLMYLDIKKRWLWFSMDMFVLVFFFFIVWGMIYSGYI